MQPTSSDQQHSFELNEVSTGSRAALIAMPLIFLAIAVWFGTSITLLAIKHPLGNIIQFTAIAFGVCFTFTLFIVMTIAAVTFLKQEVWKTSEKGLTRIRVTSETFISWDDITKASSEFAETSDNWSINLYAHDRWYTVENPPVILAASILQHLRRRGKDDKINPPLEVRSLFVRPDQDTIPEIDWTMKSRFLWWRTVLTAFTALLIAFAVVFGGHALIASPDERRISTIIIAICMLPMAPLYGAYAWLGTRTAKSFSLRHNHFTANTVWGSVTVPWDDIKSAYWAGSWYGNGMVDRQPGVPSRSRVAVALCVRRLPVVYVPWDEDDQESTELIKAIVKRLKMLSSPINLPSPHPELRIES